MSTTLRALVVDDEPIARQIISAYIARTAGVELVGECANALDAFAALSRTGANLIFLDINMPEISGLQLARALSSAPAIVFTTAYAQHAVESYELSAVDYLLKPISYARFCRAVEKASAALEPRMPAVSKPPLSPPDFFLKSDGRMVRVAPADILFVEARKDYVQYQMVDKAIVVHATMKATEETLAQVGHFVRVHKSFLVNWAHVREVGSAALRVGEHDIPVGGSYREAVAAAMEAARSAAMPR